MTSESKKKKKLIRLAILASGQGSNAESIISYAQNKKFADKLVVQLILTDRPCAGVIDRGARLGIPVKVVPRKGKRREHELKIWEILKEEQVDWLLLAGYMRILTPDFLINFKDSKLGHFRVINIHPSLLPAFPGMNAYQQAFSQNVKISGITVHLVDQGVDTGPILLRKSFERKELDDFESFQERGLAIEHKLYPKVLDLIISGPIISRLITRLEVFPKKRKSLDKVGRGKFYLLNIPKYELEEGDDLKEKLAEIFCDPVLEDISFNDENEGPSDRPSFVCEVSYKAGVTDNLANTAKEALKIVLNRTVEVRSGDIYYFYESQDIKQVQTFANNFLGNKLLHNIDCYHFDHWLIHKSHNQTNPFTTNSTTAKNAQVEVINLKQHIDKLQKLSKDRLWALSRVELTEIKKYFEKRELGPTDVEMEVLAQTWSEHCKHKIFRAQIEYYEDDLPKQSIDGLFKEYLVDTTKKIIEERGINWCLSVFKDNAGIVRFGSKLDLSVKVETHNSPSALDPYGGALTGILGVNRDILGAGLGHRPILNTNVFCLGPPDSRLKLPEGLKHPKQVLEGVHRGIEDGGNQSGIPTVNGAMIFDHQFSGKPLIFCGTVGVAPQKSKDGKSLVEKDPKPGDRLVMAGGLVGLDGIHGATFSSMELNQDSPTSAVQIGDPITQKRLMDFMLEAQDNLLFSSITDNGAGGLSSSVGEMAQLTGGATIDLGLVPTKYPGLNPYQIMISESQERMTFGVPAKKMAAFMDLAQRRGVVATDIGEFTSSGFFEAYYHRERVCQLGLDFLHNKVPTMKLKATYGRHRNKKANLLSSSCSSVKIEEAICKILSAPDVQSKESLIRRYDHEVQAATHIKPFMGQTQKGPCDAGVISLYPHGEDENKAISISCGIMPRLSKYDTYVMARAALDEAVRNGVAVGANLEKMVLVDNFCWPDPIDNDDHQKMGELVSACKGLADLAIAYGLPFVSGKDSMKNDFRGFYDDGKAAKISIPPTILITALADIPDIRNTVTSYFKRPGDLIFILGSPQYGLRGSLFEQFFSLEGLDDDLPVLDAENNLALYRQIYNGISKQIFSSVHDISDGGAIVSIIEGMFGQGLGADISYLGKKKVEWLFSEAPGRFIVSISEDKLPLFFDIFSSNQSTYMHIGQVKGEGDKFILNKKTCYSQKELLDLWGGFSAFA